MGAGRNRRRSIGVRGRTAVAGYNGVTMRRVVALVVVASVLTGCGGPGPDDDGGPDDPPTGQASDYVIDAAGFPATRTMLETAGWDCYDTVEDPSPVRRCYLDALTGDPAGSVTFRFLDPEHVGYVNVQVQGVDLVAVEVARDAVAIAIGGGLLTGRGADLVAALRTGQVGQVAGAQVTRGEQGSFEVIDPTLLQMPPQDGDVLPPLAELEEVRPDLEQGGLVCEELGETIVSCAGDVGSLSLRLDAGLGSDGSTREWYASVGSLEPISNQQGMDELVSLLQETGIVGEEAGAILRAGLRPEGVNADAEGHHIYVYPIDDPLAELFLVQLIVDRRVVSR